MISLKKFLVIIFHYNPGMEYQRISIDPNNPISTRVITQRWKQYGLTTNLIWTGCPHKLSWWATTFIFFHKVTRNQFTRQGEGLTREVNKDAISWTLYRVGRQFWIPRKMLPLNPIKSHLFLLIIISRSLFSFWNKIL